MGTQIKSILQNDKVCYLCGSQTGLERHHIMSGTANKRLAEKYGLWVWLCGQTCHRGVDGAQYDPDKNRMLKRAAQTAFEAEYGHEKWMDVFKKNYL